jgi:hypothetical protein
VECALRSSGLLHLEASQARVCKSSLKTGGGATRIVYVASSRMSREDQAEDGWIDVTDCIRLCYPYFSVFIVLGPRDIFIFYSFT